MNALADAIIIQWGWRRAALAFIAGAASVLALAPLDIWAVCFLTIPVLVWLIDGAAAPDGSGALRQLLPAAAVGWWFGFGYFLAGLWWIGAAFLIDAAEFGWLMPIAVVALPAGLALFWAFGAALARFFWSDRWSRVLVFAAAMSLAEWLRGHAFTGFPWNAFGYALMPTPTLMQSASLFGLWGATLLAFLVFSGPALAAGMVGRGRARWLALAALAALFAAHATFGLIRLRGVEDSAVPNVSLRVVQPNIDQSIKWDPDSADEIFRRHLRLTETALAPERTRTGTATLVIWPESALPFLLTEEPGALAAIAEALPPGSTLITGAARVEPFVPGADAPRVFNSIYVLNEEGVIEEAYDKVHLVPFGEYLPLRGMLEGLGLRQLVQAPGGFSAGPRLRTIPLPTAPPFGPLICYEIIFPGAVVEPGNRPGWLLNVTNDGWYGDTPGPRQHFRQAVVRAVEEGLPLVRAANTGISAIVDPYGRVQASLDVGAAGVIDGELPRSLAAPLYARFGDSIFGILLLIISGIAAIDRFTSIKARR